MNLKITRIGSIDEGIDGSDEYLLVQNLDGDLYPKQAREHFKALCCQRSTHPGGYFCDQVSAVQAQHSDDTVIVTIHHRYDV